MQRQISDSSTQKDEEKKAQKLVKTLGEQKKVPETLVKKGNPLPQIPDYRLPNKTERRLTRNSESLNRP